MTYGKNQYTFAIQSPAGTRNIALDAVNDKEALYFASNALGADDIVITFSKKSCASSIDLIHDFLEREFIDNDMALDGAEFLFRATPEWWENEIVQYFDLGIGDNACCLDKPVCYEMLDDAITDFIIKHCVRFFHAEDRIFCMVDFTLLNDGSWFEFHNGELIGSTVIDGWCWESETDTDEDFLDFFGDKIRATINSFLARIRG